MKKRLTLFIILGAIIALSATAVIVAAANGAFDTATQDPALNEPQAALGPFDIDRTAAPHKLYTAEDGKKIALTYEKTLNAKGKTFNYYLDEDGNSYCYNADGTLVSVQKPLTVEPESDTKIPLASLEETAKAKAIELFGKEEMAKYTYTKCIEGATGQNRYFFVQYIGAEKHIRGPMLILTYMADGRYVSYALNNAEGFDDFDQTRLKNYSKATLEKLVQADFEKLQKELRAYQSATCEIDKCRLIYEEETYYIEVSAKICRGAIHVNTETLKYPVK